MNENGMQEKQARLKALGLAVSRYDFVYVIDGKNVNFNGNIDDDGAPKIDPVTGKARASNAMLNRLSRDYVLLTRGGVAGFDVFCKANTVRNYGIAAAYAELGIDLSKAPEDPVDGKKRRTKGKGQESEVDRALALLCKGYWDVRVFGGVFTTGANAGALTGAVLPFTGETVDRVNVVNDTNFSCNVATEEEAEKQGGGTLTFGHRYCIHYGAMVYQGTVNPHWAAKSGMTETDLALYWETLMLGFEQFMSEFKGRITARKLVVFKHASMLGDCQSAKLFDRVTIQRKDPSRPASEWQDYSVLVNTNGLPKGMTVEEKIL